mmetsp:Transcript_70595/g.165366  ORF Transcript_70595/g.165366 Transcript_70595/m.165366 type:complete len:356 (-) Transcript_70595:151-1218(-)
MGHAVDPFSACFQAIFLCHDLWHEISLRIKRTMIQSTLEESHEEQTEPEVEESAHHCHVDERRNGCKKRLDDQPDGAGLSNQSKWPQHRHHFERADRLQFRQVRGEEFRHQVSQPTKGDHEVQNVPGHTEKAGQLSGPTFTRVLPQTHNHHPNEHLQEHDTHRQPIDDHLQEGHLRVRIREGVLKGQRNGGENDDEHHNRLEAGRANNAPCTASKQLRDRRLLIRQRCTVPGFALLVLLMHDRLVFRQVLQLRQQHDVPDDLWRLLQGDLLALRRHRPMLCILTTLHRASQWCFGILQASTRPDTRRSDSGCSASRPPVAFYEAFLSGVRGVGELGPDRAAGEGLRRTWSRWVVA